MKIEIKAETKRELIFRLYQTAEDLKKVEIGKDDGSFYVNDYSLLEIEQFEEVERDLISKTDLINELI